MFEPVAKCSDILKESNTNTETSDSHFTLILLIFPNIYMINRLFFAWIIFSCIDFSHSNFREISKPLQPLQEYNYECLHWKVAVSGIQIHYVASMCK